MSEIENVAGHEGPAPGARVTEDDVDNAIVAEQYYVFPGTTVTVCCLTLHNGFNTTGESACVVKANFDPEVGKKLARQRAREEVWQLLGYQLAQGIHEYNVTTHEPQSKILG